MGGGIGRAAVLGGAVLRGLTVVSVGLQKNKTTTGQDLSNKNRYNALSRNWHKF